MLRSVVKKSAYTLIGASVIGGSSITAYANSEQGKGLKRQIQFWSNLAPIIANYYVYTSSYSPYVKLEKFIFYNDDDDGEKYKSKRKSTIKALHEKHAPYLLHILQSLKGLYIKLGQVLSVSALPIPQVYKKELRVLQSDVPGYEDYETVIKSIIENELDQSVEDVFEVIEPVPCGAASIGQAHRAKLKDKHKTMQNNNSDDFDVVIKVQYPHARWQVPADIECIGQFLKFCIWADLVDESSAQMSYEEFSRQFLSELDYTTESENLKLIYESSLDHVNAPYHKRNVIVPKVYESLSTDKVITMEYIPGPKMEEEARKQLELLGIKTDRSIKDIVKDAAKHSDDLVQNGSNEFDENTPNGNQSKEYQSKQMNFTKKDKIIYPRKGNATNWRRTVLSAIGNIVGVDNIFWMMRQLRRIIFFTQASTVKLIHSVPQTIIPLSWNDWAKNHEKVSTHAAAFNLTKEWIDALFDVHGHQIFHLACFNADCHPGNILVVQDTKSGLPTKKLGLIDFGQCKRLTADEQLLIAKLILSVAKNESDLMIANNFRNLGIKTKEDSTEFLAKFSKLMFGPFQPEHMDHKWHMELHNMDKVLYFPKELSMVYRTSLLLRGLALSLQINCSVSEQWKHHAQRVVDGIGK